ncbi:RHO1 GDP-GTP exchange protein 2 [Tulasnella sp. 408]|nr:RHO1 GDP-GTP exchange protein 2 [Tulasnella sp. 408]
MAGELSSGQKPTRESDVYAFGGLILTVMSNQAPFYGLSQLAILRRIIQNELPKPEDHPSLQDQDPLWNLMRRCWDQSPVARPAIDQVLVKLGEVIAQERPDPLLSIDPPAAIEDGGNSYSEVDVPIPGGEQPEEMISLNTTVKALDPVLGTAPNERRLSGSSTDGAPLPSGSSTLPLEADSLTRREDEWDDGDGLPRTLRRQPGLDATKEEPALGGMRNNEILVGIPVTELGSGSGSGLPPSRRDATSPMSQTPATPPPPSPHHTHFRPTKKPIVYSALLSRVAEAFRDRITLSKLIKDGLSYPDAFDGQDAVDIIANIINTLDRNLAILLGRAMGAQGFFHDVTYNHKLRDSPREIYQLQARPLIPFVEDEMVSAVPMESISQPSTDDAPLPCGVFTLLTDCYSPTCTRDALCYSWACPRRLAQQARLNKKSQLSLRRRLGNESLGDTPIREIPGLRRSLRNESLGDTPIRETGTLWIHSVPPEIAANVSDQEKKRQEAINEVIYTERDFVRDMEYLRDCWVEPLRTSDIIAEPRRIQFVQQVFWNLDEIIAVNTRLRDALNKRQKSSAIVETIGDIYLDVVKRFEPFVRYGSHQLYGKFEFDKEKSSNAVFAQFVEDTERLPESRKLELNGYLTKPTIRLAQYPHLLEVVLKYTSDDNPDKVRLVEVVRIIRGFLKRVNEESGKTASRFNLLQLDQQLVFRDGEQVDLRLRDENRELVYKGTLQRRGWQGDNGDLQVFLFDHALLMVKAKTKHEQFRVYKRPIPVELLVVAAQEEPTNRSTNKNNRQTIVRRSMFSRGDKDKDRENGFLPLPPTSDSKSGCPITFMHLGRKGYALTLWASTVIERKKWLEEIAKQQVMRERNMTFDTLSLSEGFFGENKVNCAAPFSVYYMVGMRHHGSQIAYATDNGVYFSDLRDRSRPPVHVLALLDVMQVDVLEEYELLVVLSERSVMTVPLDALDPEDPTAGVKRATKVCSHTSFFKTGTCLGRTLICAVKASPPSSTIKVLEPTKKAVRGENKPTFRKLLQRGDETLTIFKEFYLPTELSSVHLLKTRLCVGCTKGFQIVDLETLDTQSLLDPADPSLDFVQKRENARPIAIYRIETEFLLCYDERMAGPSELDRALGGLSHFLWCVHLFSMHPTSPTFIEIRNINTGRLVQTIPGSNLRCLFAETSPSIVHSADTYTHPYGRRNPYIYPQVANATPQEGDWDHPGTASSMFLPFDGSSLYTRNKIIVVSDNKVMAVRLAPALASRPQVPSIMASEETSGNASVRSDVTSAYFTAVSNLSFE